MDSQKKAIALVFILIAFSIASAAAAPTVDLLSPAHLTNQSSSEITFQCNASDDIGLANITLYTNISGSFAANVTNTTGLANGTAWSHKETVANGNYNWNCFAMDSNSSSAFAPANRTLTVDTILPTITLSAPVTTANLSYGTNIDFTYTPTDSNLRNCSLWINHTGTFSRNQNTSSPLTGVANHMYSNLTNGSYIWNVECFDTSGNSAFATVNQTLPNWIVDGNRTYNLSGTDEGNWIGGNYIDDLAYDSVHDLVYIGSYNGVFGVYNRTSNVTKNLSGTDEGDWIGGNIIDAIAYDSVHDLVYVSGYDLLEIATPFGVFNRSKNVTDDLRGSDESNWIGGNGINAIAYDSVHDLVYLGGNAGVFGIYNRSKNVTDDLRGSDESNWIGGNYIDDLAYDSVHDLVYVSGYNGVFGVYNRTSNVTKNLSGTDEGDWIGGNIIDVLAYDSVHDLVYVSGYDLLEIATPFGVFNRSKNVTDDLRGSDESNWIGGNNIDAITYDSVHDLVYLGGNAGVFGVYNRLFVSSNFTLTVDTILPTVTLSAPVTKSNLSYGTNIDFTYTPTDSNLRNCSLWINNTGTFSRNQNTSSLTTSVANHMYSNLTNGSFIWNVECFDNSENSAFASANFTLTVDTLAPSITLYRPVDYTNTSQTTNIQFNYTPTDSNLRNCSLWINISGTFSRNQNTSTLTTGVYNYLYSNLTDSTYRWNIQCYDTAENNAFATANYTLTVDSTLPSVTLNNPIGEILTDIQNVQFNYTPVNSNLRNCSLWMNSTGAWALNKTTTTLTNNAFNYFYVNMTKGNFSWNVECYDTSGNSAFSTNESFRLNTAPVPPVITYLGGAAYDFSKLTCQASGSTDADSDLITYYYQFRDTDKNRTLQDWSTIPTFKCDDHADCKEGDILWCFVKAYDGIEENCNATPVGKKINEWNDGSVPPEDLGGGGTGGEEETTTTIIPSGEQAYPEFEFDVNIKNMLYTTGKLTYDLYVKNMKDVSGEARVRLTYSGGGEVVKQTTEQLKISAKTPAMCSTDSCPIHIEALVDGIDKLQVEILNIPDESGGVNKIYASAEHTVSGTEFCLSDGDCPSGKSCEAFHCVEKKAFPTLPAGIPVDSKTIAIAVIIVSLIGSFIIYQRGSSYY